MNTLSGRKKTVGGSRQRYKHCCAVVDARDTAAAIEGTAANLVQNVRERL